MGNSTITVPSAPDSVKTEDIDTLAELNTIVTDATLIDTADPRLSDARTPIAHTHTLSEIADAGTSAALDVPGIGDAAIGQVVKGDDTRLTDERNPSPHTHPASEVTDFDVEVGNNTDVSANTTHRGLTNNPHSVTKSQVGLGSVPNVDATSRSNHTGTQTASTISNFDTEVSNNSSVVANTAKVGLPTGGTTDQVLSKVDGTDFNVQWATGGESNTTSNDGAGEGLAKAKSGVDLPFKSLVGGTDISLSSDANTVTITHSKSSDVILNSLHRGATNNPHSVTKSQVGLGSVPNVDATDRSNHTGTQTASTISDFDTEVSNNTDVIANTNKVSADGSIATHSDVNLTGLSDGDTLLFNQSAGLFVPGVAGGSGPTVIFTHPNSDTSVTNDDINWTDVPGMEWNIPPFTTGNFMFRIVSDSASTPDLEWRFSVISGSFTTFNYITDLPDVDQIPRDITDTNFIPGQNVPTLGHYSGVFRSQFATTFKLQMRQGTSSGSASTITRDSSMVIIHE
jgi:hypothetical protein